MSCQFSLGATFPNFEVDSTHGKFNLYDYQKDSWLIFCVHPIVFNPVSTTEIATAIKLQPEFAKRNVKMIALAGDSVAGTPITLDKFSLFIYIGILFREFGLG